jgi:molybdopterin-containing oxidoreductase family iron-sulfur binding subunit
MSEMNTETGRRRYWRSLDELQQTPEFVQFLHREFPVAASEYPEGVSRRRWLQLMGASLAMAGAVGCRYPEEAIVPFVIRPEGRIPGESYERATNFELAGRAHHLLVSCVDGRPLKIEGNADHPGTNGGTDAYVQASILGLYDPDRSDSLKRVEGKKRRVADWKAFQDAIPAIMASAKQSGSGMAVLMPPTHSPSLVRMVARLKQLVPQATVCVHDSVSNGVAGQGLSLATGQTARPLYAIENAKIILTVESDILGTHPLFLRNAQGYGQRRDPVGGEMNRMYVVEGGYSSTGMSADSRLPLRPSQMAAFLSSLERRIDAMADEQPVAASPEEKPYDTLSEAERIERFLDVLARDLVGAKGESLVVVGDALGPEAVAAGYRLNDKLENFGKTLQFVEPVDSDLGETVSLDGLVGQIEKGEIDTLLILGGNPVFTAPADLQLAKQIAAVDTTIYLGEYDDETAVLCDWALPQAHPLESWGDCVGDNGFYGVCQPNILPLMDGRSAIEVLAMLAGDAESDGETIVRRTADQVAGGSLSNREWRKLLYAGYLDELRYPMVQLAYSGPTELLTEAEPQAVTEVDKDSVEVLFVPADGLYDGRFANSGWLQEMPQTLTKLTWDNAAIMGPATAAAIGVSHGVKVALTRGSQTLELPVFVIPGIALGVVTAVYGYGRTRAGAVGGHVDLGVEPVGVDVGPLRTTDAMLLAADVEARPRPRSEYPMATTQNHWAIDDLGREETEDRSYQLIREGTNELFKTLPTFAKYMGVHSPDTGSLWVEPINAIEQERPSLPQWGMSVDLGKCIGCNACVIACQSENNVPIVGKEQVLMGREMHWMRIDRYFQGDEDYVDVVQEPMMCQHCETAPCEQVCPVAATVHTDEGINAMAYNRCIGTRYCANNCPFKVRRFNYFNWNEDVGVGYGIDAYQGNIEKANRKLQQLVLNPEVTVRGRGVMEKCTYCVQRVEKAKIEARKDGGRPIRDGDVKTACQTACPTQAIQFGNILDDQSQVFADRANPRNYGMLDQLNIGPRTTYLARINNPHVRLMTERQLIELKELPKKAAHHSSHGSGDHEGDHHEDGDHATSDHSNESAEGANAAATH